MPARLITIGPSHYCEKARWALDRLGIAYVEERHAPLTHVPALLRAHAGMTTPVLVTDGVAVGDSTAVLRHLDRDAPEELRLYPADPAARLEVSALEAFFDEELGPETRRWAYSWILPDRPLLLRVLGPGVDPVEFAVFKRVTAVARRAIRMRFAMDDATRERAAARVREVFEQVATLLADGRRYLAGDRLSAADVALGDLRLPRETGWRVRDAPLPRGPAPAAPTPRDAELDSGIAHLDSIPMQEMVIYGVSFDMVGKQPIVLLKTREGNKFLPIWIGHPEAAAILMKLQGANTPRPMTHDLINDMLGEIDVSCTRVSVTELRENTFYASITLQVNGREVEIDSRPSDALALAVRTSAPIFAAEDVIAESAIEFEHEGEDNEEVVDKFKEFLDNVSPEDFASEDG